MKHQNGHIACVLLVGSDEEGAERLAVRRRNEEFFEVGDTELRWPWHVGTSVRGKAPGIYDLTVAVSQ